MKNLLKSNYFKAAGVAALGISTFFSGSDSVRSRGAVVHEHPKGYDEGRSSSAGAGAMLGAIAAAISLRNKSLSPAARACIGIGAAVAGTVGLSHFYKNDSEPSILASVGAGAAATLAFLLVKNQKTIGIRALRDFASKHNSSRAVESFIGAHNDARKLFPGISELLSREGYSLGAGLVTFPVAHSIMVKHFAAEKRRAGDTSDTAFMASWQSNNAGQTNQKVSNAPLFRYNSANTADVNFSGSLNSYYNSASVFEGI